MASGVCICDYCDSVIQYDDTDMRLAPGALNQIYVTCPVCGKPITIGTTDYPDWGF